MLCDGRKLDRARYSILFHLLGTRYGGGPGYFNLPDLRGRVPAGTDPRRQRFAGDTSGAGADGTGEGAIPYQVVNWAISLEGIFPQERR